MAELSELKAERLKKLKNLESLGINPYPAKISLDGKKISSEQAKETLEKGESKDLYVFAGRVMTIRGQGKILFIDVADEAGKLQVVLKEDVLGVDKLKMFFENIDGGDFLAFSGKLFVTQKGEKSLEASDWQILAKALLPMPSTFYGLENEEEAMRKRYLDLALDKSKRDMFERKAKFWKTVRVFLEERGFLEVETPTVETTTGGAEARPFKTYHNDYDLDVYMRISIGELWQKRLLAAGFEKSFEIGRAYRNEGSSPVHLQEFTNCEFYWAYADYKDGMKLVRDMYIEIAQQVYGKTSFKIGNHEFDLKDQWKEIDYRSEVLERTGIDVVTADAEDMKAKLVELDVKWDGHNRERLTDTLWKYCRKQISGPAFLVNHPVLTSPLAKRNPDGVTAQVFQPIIAGAEAGRGFSELNDARLQRQNFEEQQKLLEGGDEEAMMPDWEFVEMLEHGMPPAFGYGFGERMFSFFEGLTIRETTLFPLVKPKGEDKTKGSKKKETKVVVALLNEGAGLQKWQEMNTIAHLSAEFAARTGKELFYTNKIQTKDGENINLNIQHAIIVKGIESSKEILNFISEAKEQGVEAFTFTKEMLETTNDKKVIEATKGKNLEEIEFMGVLVFGEKSKIEGLTGKYSLYK